MSDRFLSLLDITSRRGTSAAVGLIEEVVTYAPELDKVMGRPIPGTSYKARVRTSFTSKPAFRSANAGVEIGASAYTQRRFDCFFFDAQLQVDEALARAAENEGDTLATLQADEASGAMQQKAIALGAQFYRGTTADPAGFPGLIDLLYANQIVDAGGSGAGACERVWFVWMDVKGVHFLFGGNQGLDIKPWQLQQVKDASNKSLMAWVSNISGYIGLSSAHTRAIGCVKNVDNTLANGNEAKPFTDKLAADLLSKFPVGIQPNLIFMSRASRRGLQKSRTVTLQGDGKRGSVGAATGLVAPLPTEVQGVPIVVTDSIPLENAA
jgi:hypothetical protein